MAAKICARDTASSVISSSAQDSIEPGGQMSAQSSFDFCLLCFRLLSFGVRRSPASVKTRKQWRPLLTLESQKVHSVYILLFYSVILARILIDGSV